MEGYSRKDEGCHQFLDLIPKQREWFVKREEENTSNEDKKLELSLGPPGGDWTITDNNISQNTSRNKDHEFLLSFGYFSNNPCSQNPVLRSPWPKHGLLPVTNESSQPRSNSVALDLKNSEKKTFSPAPAANTAVPNISSAQKRTAPASVVGWPPIRSFRKNLASGSSSKLASESTDVAPNKVSDQKPTENCPKTLFMEVNRASSFLSMIHISKSLERNHREIIAYDDNGFISRDCFGSVVDIFLDANTIFREYED
ncbi:hypothetical protein DH2020_038245 [Rehmannia glutinosa]|uniref:Auxin-responsive protein n=1 Tax=Rehmannia glutinosa TaxID=99300 RepID=A0ABR0V0E3_REHGL